uniref:Uncharacterized protein n=1 Tax=Rhizophora mucronata TaxID=61149 RepID=A0A2P2N3X0_RHIMU
MKTESLFNGPESLAVRVASRKLSGKQLGWLCTHASQRAQLFYR